MLWVWVSCLPSVLSVVCPMRFTADELMTVPVRVGNEIEELVVDTGSFSNVVLGKHIRTTHAKMTPLLFQQVHINHAVISRQPVEMQCGHDEFLKLNSKIFVAPEKINGVKGILGFSLERLRGFDWHRIEIALPEIGSPDQPKLTIYEDENSMADVWDKKNPVNSNYYWSFRILELRISHQVIHLSQPTSVIFDTGSNYFGFSENLFNAIEPLLRSNCGGSVIAVDSMEFDHVPVRESEECRPALFLVDPSRFAGDLKQQEIVIIGTRGLRGKTLTLHKHRSTKDDVYYLSVNYSKLREGYLL